MTRCPFPSAGSAWVRVPLPRRYSEALRLPAVLRSSSLPWVRATVLRRKRQGLPRFLGNPCKHAPVHDPGEASTSGHGPAGPLTRRYCLPPDARCRPSQKDTFSGLTLRGLLARCLRLAVTVTRVLPTTAQDSLPAGALLGRAGPDASALGSNVKFQLCRALLRHCFLLTQAFLAQASLRLGGFSGMRRRTVRGAAHPAEFEATAGLGRLAAEGSNLRALDDDVALVFPDSAQVNAAPPRPRPRKRRVA